LEVKNLNDYLIQTEYAASSLIDLIRAEEIALDALKSSLSSLKIQQQPLYEDFLRKDLDPDGNFDEFQTMHAFKKQASNQKQIELTKEKIVDMNTSISSKEESIKALSGALLQIAKQGISIVYGSLTTCPSGRIINNEPIKNIIWQGRNQSMHFEEGNYKTPTIRCFSNIGLTLHVENLAKEIIDLLDWTTYDNYKNDLIRIIFFEAPSFGVSFLIVCSNH
jgi:hypothetical protein